MAKKDKKLPKITPELAKLYQDAGFGIIANELPFMCRVQHELRQNGVSVWVKSYSLESFEAHVSKPVTLKDMFRSDKIIKPVRFKQEDFYTYEEAMLVALEFGLNLLIPKKR